MAERREEDCVAASHPSLAGHFPGNPIVPGVVLLDRVMAAVRRHFGAVEFTALTSAKFLHPLLPDQRYAIVLDASDDGRSIRFRCEAAGQLLAQGTLSVAAAP